MNTITISTTKELGNALGATVNELIAMDSIKETDIQGHFKNELPDDSNLETLSIVFPQPYGDIDKDAEIYDQIQMDFLTIYFHTVGIWNKPALETHYYIYNDNESVLVKANDESLTIVYQNTNQN